jgi:hypothetical protein
MAEVPLKIVADLDGERHLRRARRRINEITVAAKALHRQVEFTSKKYSKNLLDSIDRTDGRWKKHFDDMDKIIKQFGAFTMGGLKLALKAAGAEMLLMAASMVTLHGLFAIGQGLMKAWTGTLNMLGGAASSAAVALAAVSAAMREQAAAMFAFRGSGMAGYGAFGNNINKVRVVMRGLHTDSTLAAAGIENLNAAYTAVSQNSTFNRGSQTMLRGLMDFASAGQDVNKGMTSAGSLVGMLQDPEKSWGEIREAAKAMGPQMEKAMEEAVKKGVDSSAELIAAIHSGQLAAWGEVSGQWDAVSGTLISRLKAAFTEIRNDFADLGQLILKPIKDQLDNVVNTFRTGFTRVYGPMVEFAKGPFIEGIGGFVEGMTDMFVSLARRGPEIEGVFGRIGDRWKGFVDGWNNVLDRLRPFIDGARVIESAFGNMWHEISQYFRDAFGTFNEFLINNKPLVDDFGTKMGQLFAAFGDFQQEMKDLMQRSLPYINKVIDGVASVVRSMAGLMQFLKGIVGTMGDGSGAYGLLAAAMVILSKLRSWAGGFLFQKATNTMNVTAASVHVNGAVGITKGLVSGDGMGTRSAADAMTGGIGSAADMAKAKDLASKGGKGGKGGGPQQLQFPGMAPAVDSETKAKQKAAARALGQGYAGRTPTAEKLTTGQRWNRFINREPGDGPGLWGRTRVGQALRGARAGSEGLRTRINQSSGVKMGVGAGLGLASQYAPEEMQGALALGGAASFINPMMGLAIAGLGGAATSESPVAGALSGAAGGAAAGFMIGGPVGAAVGTAIGGLYGFIGSAMREEIANKKYAKAAGETIAAAIAGTYFSEEHKSKVKRMGVRALTRAELEKGFGMSRTAQQFAALSGEGAAIEAAFAPENLQNTINEMSDDDKSLPFGNAAGATTDSGARVTENFVQQIQTNALTDVNTRTKDFLIANSQELGLGDIDFEKIEDDNYINMMMGHARTAIDTNKEALDFVMDQGEATTNRLGDIMGITTDEVLNLAAATGTNLYDATKNFGEIAMSVAAGLMSSYNDLRNAAADRIATRLEGLQVGIDRAAAPEIMDEAAKNIQMMVASGDFDAANAGEELQTIFRGAVSLAGGDENAAERGMSAVMGVGGTGWLEGGALGGPEAFEQMMAVPEIATFIRSLSGVEAEQMAGAAEVIFANLLGSGRTDINLPDIEKLMTGGWQQIDKLESLGLMDAATYDLKAGPLGALLEQAGFDTGGVNLVKQEHEVAAAYENGTETFRVAVKSFSDNIGILVRSAGGGTTDNTGGGIRGEGGGGGVVGNGIEERSLGLDDLQGSEGYVG